MDLTYEALVKGSKQYIVTYLQISILKYDFLYYVTNKFIIISRGEFNFLLLEEKNFITQFSFNSCKHKLYNSRAFNHKISFEIFQNLNSFIKNFQHNNFQTEVNNFSSHFFYVNIPCVKLFFVAP
ncbi:hypothetical protein BpHYR1_049389 [Brachionus plicatilis]|uniref:Uncharacterized protein n=1 Tax=Brachionus plicatilis TaxID=10195 RepID=A0A3M7RDJ8_BRAPC|nr:hypothetical protein BpHYR1_049389 [Brachionus plicatilis]